MFGFIKQERLLQSVRVTLREQGIEVDNLPDGAKQHIIRSVNYFQKKGGDEYDVIITLCAEMAMWLKSKNDIHGIWANTYGDRASWVNRAIAMSKLSKSNCSSDRNEAMVIMAAAILDE